MPLVYIAKQENSRSYFYGGIANIVLESDEPDSIPNDIDISEYALLHIKCFKENETPIIGNIKTQSLASAIFKFLLL